MAWPPPPHVALPGSGLHVCPLCRGDFVHLDRAAAAEDQRRRLWLRCGQCGARRDIVVPVDVAARLCADVAQGWAAIGTALRELERRQMSEFADAFAIALESDLIDADDFGG